MGIHRACTSLGVRDIGRCRSDGEWQSHDPPLPGARGEDAAVLAGVVVEMERDHGKTSGSPLGGCHDTADESHGLRDPERATGNGDADAEGGELYITPDYRRPIGHRRAEIARGWRSI